MVTYWRYQVFFDVVVVLLVTAMLTSGLADLPRLSVPAEQIVAACRLWVAPILTLLGLVCATTAFLFTALERSEFQLLRALGVEDQLWSIFSAMIFWLGIAAISSAIISFVNPSKFPDWLHAFAVFLFLMVSLCLLKFAWVMRHIIGARTQAQ
jgi:hypothetical protein